MSTILEFAIFPTDKGESVSSWVADAVLEIRKSGLPYTIGPMGSCIEGEFNEVQQVLESCYRILKKDSGRFYINASFDCRPGKTGRLQGKLDSLNCKLNRKNLEP